MACFGGDRVRLSLILGNGGMDLVDYIGSDRGLEYGREGDLRGCAGA